MIHTDQTEVIVIRDKEWPYLLAIQTWPSGSNACQTMTAAPDGPCIPQIKKLQHDQQTAENVTAAS